MQKNIINYIFGSSKRKFVINFLLFIFFYAPVFAAAGLPQIVSNHENNAALTNNTLSVRSPVIGAQGEDTGFKLINQMLSSFTVVQDACAESKLDNGAGSSSQVIGYDESRDTDSGWRIIAMVIVLTLVVAVFFWIRVDKLRFFTKIVGLGLTLLGLLALLIFVANSNMNSVGNDLRAIAKEDIPLSNSVAKIAVLQLQQSIWLERGILAQAKDDIQRLEDSISEFSDFASQADREINYAEELVQKAISNTENEDVTARFQDVLTRLTNIKTQHKDFDKQGNDLLMLAKQNMTRDETVSSDDKEAETSEDKGTENDAGVKKVQLRSLNLAGFLIGVELVQDQLNRELQALQGNIGRSTANSAQMAEQLEESARLNLTIIGIIAALMGIFMVMLILRSVMRQLGGDPNELKQITDQLAHGQLDIRIKNNATGAYASITNTVIKLKEIISSIKASADEVRVAAEQVSEGNTSLSQRTQEQASSLEEVASSMEEMTGTVSQNADNAQQANQLATAARKQADEGGEVVSRAVSSMHEISESSEKIADIIGVIDEIAFQTNLLALNAAVEAARAGEQGRGFAVVAGEVRNLAGRSATAAKEIKELIHNSVSKVEDGTRLVTESGEALQEIVNSVKKVSDIVAEIAAASHEQSGGIGQVNRAIMQMDDMTQQNASLVEEAAAASESMGAQAEELQTMVNFFKLSASEEEELHSKAKRRRQGKIGVYESNNGTIDRKAVTHNPAELPKPNERKNAEDSDWKEF